MLVLLTATHSPAKGPNERIPLRPTRPSFVSLRDADQPCVQFGGPAGDANTAARAFLGCVTDGERPYWGWRRGSPAQPSDDDLVCARGPVSTAGICRFSQDLALPW